jgi:Flp pilus assembly protein CpaB
MPLVKRKNKQDPHEFEAGPSMAETRTRSRKLIVAGVVLALCAGLGSYVLISRAQQSVGVPEIPKVALVVAAHTISARTPIAEADLLIREVPMDVTNAQGTFTSIDQVVGRVSGITILQGQMVTSNLFTFSAGAASVSILDPGESVTPESPDWRAVSISVPDDRAVAGVVAAGEHVDIFVTTTINVNETLSASGQFYGDKSTKVVYQDVVILNKAGNFYVIKVTEQVAEEIAHMQAAGNASFSFALRPDVDNRAVDASKLGATTNIIIQRYGLPVPQVFPQPGQAVNTGPAPVLPSPTPGPSAVAVVPPPAASTAP